MYLLPKPTCAWLLPIDGLGFNSLNTSCYHFRDETQEIPSQDRVLLSRAIDLQIRERVIMQLDGQFARGCVCCVGLLLLPVTFITGTMVSQ